MADILIRNMEMPKDGRIIIQIGANGAVYFVEECTILAEKYEKSSHAISLPAGHGRLGDLDKIEENLRMVATYQTGERQQGILGCCETVRMTKTIVPAEGGNIDGN